MSVNLTQVLIIATLAIKEKIGGDVFAIEFDDNLGDSYRYKDGSGDEWKKAYLGPNFIKHVAAANSPDMKQVAAAEMNFEGGRLYSGLSKLN